MWVVSDIEGRCPCGLRRERLSQNVSLRALLDIFYAGAGVCRMGPHGSDMGRTTATLGEVDIRSILLW